MKPKLRYRDLHVYILYQRQFQKLYSLVTLATDPEAEAHMRNNAMIWVARYLYRWGYWNGVGRLGVVTIDYVPEAPGL